MTNDQLVAARQLLNLASVNLTSIERNRLLAWLDGETVFATAARYHCSTRAVAKSRLNALNKMRQAFLDLGIADFRALLEVLEGSHPDRSVL